MHRAALALLVLAALAGCAPAAPPSTTSDAAHLDAMAREHAHEAPRPNASAQAPADSVIAEEVTYGTVDGRPVTGYLARPANAPADARFPALIVIHEWWGLNDNIRMMTRRLAGEGYVALAVDMYGGRAATTPEQARALMSGVMDNPETGERNLRMAAEFLGERGHERIGTIGWCFGGGWSLRAGLALPERVDAVVMYYGRPVTERAELARLDAPLLGLFGAEDEGIPVERVREMEATLRELNKDATIQVYPGAGHAFANPSGDAYRPEVAEDAWRRTIAFLDRHLKGGG